MNNQSMQRARFEGNIETNRILVPQNAIIRSIWETELWRDGKLIQLGRDTNICTDEGLNALLDIMFHGATQIATWYCILFETDTTPAAGTTYAVPVFTECEAYSEGTRPEFVEAAASGKSLSNSANKASYSINATKTLYGGALVGGGTAASTKGDTAGGGTMYCAAPFTSAKSVESGDTFKLTVTLTSADVV